MIPIDERLVHLKSKSTTICSSNIIPAFSPQRLMCSPIFPSKLSNPRL